MSIDNIVNEEKPRMETVLTSTVSRKFKKYRKLNDLFVKKEDLTRFLSMKLDEDYDITLSPYTIGILYVNEIRERCPKELSSLLGDLIKKQEEGEELIRNHNDLKYIGKSVGRKNVNKVVDDIKEIIRTKYKKVEKNTQEFSRFVVQHKPSISRKVLYNIIVASEDYSRKLSMSGESYKHLFNLKVQLENKIIEPTNKHFFRIFYKGFTNSVNSEKIRKISKEIEDMIISKYDSHKLSETSFINFLSEETSLSPMVFFKARDLDKTVSAETYIALRTLKKNVETGSIEFSNKYFKRNMNREEIKNELNETCAEIDFLKQEFFQDYLSENIVLEKRKNKDLSPGTIKNFMVDGITITSEYVLKELSAQSKKVKNDWRNRDLDEIKQYLTASYKVPADIVAHLLHLKGKLDKKTITEVSVDTSNSLDGKISPSTIKGYCCKRNLTAKREVFDVLIDSINAIIPLDNSTTTSSLITDYYKPILTEETGLLIEYTVKNLIEQRNLQDRSIANELKSLRNVKHYPQETEYELSSVVHHDQFGIGIVKAVYGNGGSNIGKIRVDFFEEGEKLLLSGRK